MTGTRCIEFKGYRICDDGTIYNKDGTKKSLKTNKKGYLFTNFWYDGKSNCHVAQRFIWYAFRGGVPEGFEIDHIDNNRANNRLDNLQLLTKSQNNKKAYDSGNRMFVFGDTNPNSLKRKHKQYGA